MTNTLVAKIMGWGLFGMTTLGQLTTSGLPHGVFGWLTLLGSLANAIGLHAASSTEGVK